MRIDKAQISGRQFMLAMICFLQASSLLMAFLSGITTRDSWLVLIFAILVGLPVIWVYRELMLLFPEENLIQVLEHVLGPLAGRILGGLYVWFFFSLTSLNLMDEGDFTKLTLMRDTPQVLMMTLCILVALIAVRRDVRLVTQYGALFMSINFIILTITILLLLNQLDVAHFFPILDQPVMSYVQGTHIALTMPFGEVVVFLMLTPNVKLTRHEATKYLFGGFLVGAFTAVISMARDIAVLGNTINLFTMPPLVTLRLVNLGTALSRIEILFAVVLIMLMFFKITVLYYVSVLALAQLLRVKPYRRLTLAAGALILSYGLTLYRCPVEHTASAREVVPAAWTFFELVIPLLLLLVAKFRGMSAGKEA